MLSPKKTKYRKQQKQARRIKITATRGCNLNFGEFGLRATEGGWINARRIEAARKAISKSVKKTGKLWIRIFPDKPITKKPAETRMGSGKGAPEYWVAEVRPGGILFEVTGVNKEIAEEALLFAGTKLGLRTEFVARSNFML